MKQISEEQLNKAINMYKVYLLINKDYLDDEEYVKIENEMKDLQKL
jgi:formiminotetrahydrofolate cyclodeaminase